MRRELRPWAMSALTAVVVSAGSPQPALAEGHLARPDADCIVEAPLAYPLRVAASHKARRAASDWRLLEGGRLLYRTLEEFASLTLASGEWKKLSGGPGADRQVQAALGGSRLFVLSAPQFGSGDGPVTVQAFSTVTFTPLWTAQPWANATMPLLAGPLATSGGILAGAGSTLVMLEGASGRTVWSRDAGGFLGSFLAMDGGTVVLIHLNGVEALSAADGKTQWRYPLDPGDFNPSRAPVLFQGKVYLPDSQNTVVALDLATGGLLWRSSFLPASIDLRHPVMAGASGVLVPIEGGVARLSSSGSLTWLRTYPFLKMRASRPALTWFSNVIAAGGADGLYLLSPTGGEVVAQAEGLGQIEDLVPYGGGLAASNSDGVVHVLTP